MKVFYTDAFTLPLPDGHRFPIRKYALLRERVAELAPVMNRVVSVARDKGVFIIQAPSGTIDHYKDRPARLVAQNAPKAAGFAALPAAAQDKFTLQLNWFHLADHSPIYVALKKGYYKEEGIDLTVLRGSGSADSAKKIGTPISMRE